MRVMSERLQPGSVLAYALAAVAALGVALFDVFFVEPRFSFSVSDARYLVTFAVMLVVALIISYLASGLQQQARTATAREQQTRDLYLLASKLTGVMTLSQLHDAVREFSHGIVDAKLLLLLPTADEILDTVIDEAQLDDTDRLAALTAYQHGSFIETRVLACGERGGIFVPLVGATRHRGVLGFVVLQQEFARLQSMQPMLRAAGDIVAAAVERLHFVDVAGRAELEISTERLRSSILSALSHDIRTPLAVQELVPLGLELDAMSATYFCARTAIIDGLGVNSPGKMPRWQSAIYGWMLRQSESVALYFHLPPNRVVELGTQVVL